MMPANDRGKFGLRTIVVEYPSLGKATAVRVFWIVERVRIGASA
jgi:hypothetical protein